MLINNDRPQLMPFEYPWAWDEFKNICKNHWLPQEISMGADVAQWKSKDALTKDEKFLIQKILSFFANTDVLVSTNLWLGIYNGISNPECRQYFCAQAFQEAVHSWSYAHIVESLSMDQELIFSEFKKTGVIKDKHDNQESFFINLKTSSDSLHTLEGRSEFLRNLCAYYLGLEGMQFYSAFVLLLNFKRRNLLVGTAEQLEYIVRDESLHCKFGTQLINQFIKENPEVWTEALKAQVTLDIHKIVELEDDFIKEALPKDILGMTIENFRSYIRYIADRRLESVGIQAVYGIAETPFPWMNEIMDLPKEKNFFESRVIEYQSGMGLSW
jgi:ribonucleoside-diphosphate reductase beta chain